jgi:hypothetical protein
MHSEPTPHSCCLTLENLPKHGVENLQRSTGEEDTHVRTTPHTNRTPHTTLPEVKERWKRWKRREKLSKVREVREIREVREVRRVKGGEGR